MRDKENILEILIEAKKAVEKSDPYKLKVLSQKTIHTSSSTGDPDNILVGVVLYALGKIFERGDYRTLKGWKEFEMLVNSAIETSIIDLRKGHDEKFAQDFIQIRRAINKLSGKLKKYIEEVFEKSDVNKASRIYEHGISLEKTAKLLGITIYDLANYTGETGISEVSLNETIDERTRVKIMEKIFS